MKKSLSKNVLNFVVITLVLLSFSILASAAAPQHPILVTSAGQSADDMILKVMLERQFGVEVARESLATPEHLEGKNTLALVVGVSNKGLGSAGINLDQEIDRIKSLLEAAIENDLYVLLVHIGGPSRRGAGSDQVAGIVGAFANKIIVTEESNQDAFFDNLGDAEVIMVATRNDAATTIVELFK